MEATLNTTKVREWKRYKSYKDCGQPSISLIPENWKSARLKWVLSKVGSGKTPRGGGDSYVSDGVMFLRSQNIHFSGLVLDDIVCIDDETDAEMSISRVEPNDVLLNITGASLGRCSLVPTRFGRANVNQHVCILRARTQLVDPSFLHAAVSSASTQAQIFSTENGISREGLNFSQIANLVVAFPDCTNEQRAISAFLDRETARIDALIARKHRLIELLEEKRKTIISHAVTKGLNLDIPMRNSKVDWLGSIPATWTTLPLKFLVDLKSGEGITGESITDVGKYPVYGGNGFRGFTSSYTHEGQFVLIGRQGAHCGNINYSSGKFWASEHAVVANPRRAFDTVWLGETLRAMDLNQYSMTAAQPGLSMQFVGNLRVPLPPPDEQRRLSDFMHQENEKIDSVRIKLFGSIEKLHEYRVALISAAVTGQIDVREEVEIDG